MRKATRAVVAALVLAIVMAFSAGSAFAGWGWEDCPPASDAGFANHSDQADVQWGHVTPRVNTNAIKSSSDNGDNKGNK